MRQALLALLIFSSYVVVGFEVTDFGVTDKDQAQVLITGNLANQLPRWEVVKNVLEINFPDTSLSTELSSDSKFELKSPHVLIERMTAMEDSGKLTLRMHLNGGVEGLKERVKLVPTKKGLLISLDYPSKNGNALKLLQQEQSPITSTELKTSKASSSNYSPVAIVIILFLSFTAFLGFVFVRYTKKQSSLRGTRKYLIEQVSYFPLGPKNGVSLVKIGREFVLLGVTPQNITTLSHLPKLQEQYEEESGFERGIFKESVAEEMHKMRVA